MKELVLRVVSLGRVTIPKPFREKHDIKEGDFVHATFSKAVPVKVVAEEVEA